MDSTPVSRSQELPLAAEQNLTMDSVERDPEPTTRGLVGEIYWDLETEPQIDSQQLDYEAAFYEISYQQLARDRDELRQRYEREKRDRESLEIKLHQEFDQKMLFEEKLSELSRNLEYYEEELRKLRFENSHLKAQFGQLRTAIQTKMNSGAEGIAQGGLAGASLDTGGGVFVSSSSNEGSVSVSTEMYKQEVALLAQENELFKQIIDVIDKQDYSKVILEERVSGKNNERQAWFEDEVIRLEREKSLLEDRVRELERFTHDQERLLEEANSKAEINLKVYKRESKVLENELYSKSTAVEDYEFQMLQLKQTYEEEIHQIEIKLEMEMDNNKQVQEQTHQLEDNIRKLEEERKEILLKVEEAYKTENEVIEERTALEETYSRDVSRLRSNIEEEIQKNAEFSIEIDRLMAELIESDKQRKEMEVRFFNEAQELKIQFEKEREEIISNFNGSTVNQLMMKTNVAYQTNAAPQLVSGGQGPLTTQRDLKRQLDEEIRKKEKLEEENKKLLYQINDLLEQNVCGGVSNTTRIKDSYDHSVTETSHSMGSKQNLKELMYEINELRETCQVLEREVKKKKEMENKNIELSKEIEELTFKKDEMIRKQRELVKELDNSLSSVQQVEDKNRRLIEDVEHLSRKIRQMEENFRNEKEDWMRNFTKDKTSQINDILREKEVLEKKYDEQVKINRTMEAEINSFETRIYDLERANERLERKKSEIRTQLTEEINFERNRAKTVKEELDNSVEVFKKQTEQLETTLHDRKRKYDEEIRTLEEEKQRIRSELDNEKEVYKRRFEEERKTMERRINEIVERLRQQNASHGEFVSNKVTLTHDDLPVSSTVNQTGLASTSHQTISNLKSKIDTIVIEKTELQETLYDTERKYSRKIDDLEYDNEQKIKKLRSEIEEEYRRKMDDYEKQIDHLRKTDSCQRNKGDSTSYQGGSGSMADLVRDHKEQMDELRRQIKLQLEAFENEKQNLERELQVERETLTRGKHSQHTLLHNTIHKLTEEVKKLKHEKETVLNRLKKERGNNNRRITELSETVTKVTNECDMRLRKERDDAQKSINDLRRKLTVAESKIRIIKEKHRRELHQLEAKFEYKRTVTEQDTTSIESQLRESLQMEYRVTLNKEREKYEETLRVLRKEISSLQEQRKQIQLKLSSQGIQNTYGLLMDKGVSARKELLFKSEMDVEMRVSRGTKQMEVRIYDLEREVELLQKEKFDIKASYKQEKVQIQEEFDLERDRLEEKYKRQIDDLKRRLQAATIQMQSSTVMAKKLRYTADETEFLHNQTLTLETKRGALESQMNILKGRMDDIEERQTRSLQSKTKKASNMRFSTSLERGRNFSRHSNRLSSSMLDLSSSSAQRSGKCGTPRVSLSSHNAASMSREARDNRSFFSQSLRDVRPLMQGTYRRGDQNHTSRGHGIGGSSSMASAAGQSLFSSRSPSSFFHTRSPSGGFDASRSSGLLQSRGAFRSDQLFLPSVGILGGLSQTRAGGAFGGSMFGAYSGMSGLHSGFGFQRMMPGPTVYGQAAASGFDGRLYQSASLGNLHQQSSSQVQGVSSDSASQHASVDVADSADMSVHDVKSSEVTSRQAATAAQAESSDDKKTLDAVVIPEKDSVDEKTHVMPCEIQHHEVQTAVITESPISAQEEELEGTVPPDGETSLQSADLGSNENDEEVAEQSEQA